MLASHLNNMQVSVLFFGLQVLQWHICAATVLSTFLHMPLVWQLTLDVVGNYSNSNVLNAMASTLRSLLALKVNFWHGLDVSEG